MSPIIEHIHIHPTAGQPMVAVDQALAAPKSGVAGDRIRPPKDESGDRELTLIEAEAIEAISELGFKLNPGDSRRNITTRGVRLNDLVGQEFFIGPVRCLGIRLCEPCSHLQRLLRMPGLIDALKGRGGLRARILDGGLVQRGDAIRTKPGGS